MRVHHSGFSTLGQEQPAVTAASATAGPMEAKQALREVQPTSLCTRKLVFLQCDRGK